MNDDERARILRMVAEGKLSPQEAADVLEALDQAAEQVEAARMAAAEAQNAFNDLSADPRIRVRGPEGRRSRSPRAVVIQVKEGGENKVNIRVPLGLARAAGKFIPRQAQQYLAAYEIDLQAFLGEASDMEGGTLLEVKDGENRVLIAVE
jgi:hypothetical protein